jgi:hypothetical protein
LRFFIKCAAWLPPTLLHLQVWQTIGVDILMILTVIPGELIPGERE